MPWRAPPPDRSEPEKPCLDANAPDRDNTTLMLQWVFWKHLAPKIVIDPERMQRLAEALAQEFYAEGVRMPIADDPEGIAMELQCELRLVNDQIGPVPIPMKTLRERQRKAAKLLVERGWRKIAVVLAVLLPHGALFISQ